MKQVKKAVCISCGKKDLSKDDVGITLKLINENATSFYCMDCLANYLDVSIQEIKDKIDEFKDEGCTLFQ